jgi:putative transposase
VAKDLFEDALERIRYRYDFQVIGYVAMPEHIHLLVSEPRRECLAVGLQALKLSVARRSEQSRFWQARYYDFNVFTQGKRVEKLEYMHWNPVRRGTVERMELDAPPLGLNRLRKKAVWRGVRASEGA